MERFVGVGSRIFRFYSVSKKINDTHRFFKRKIFLKFQNSQKGFIQVALVALIPFFITVSFLFFSITAGIHERTKVFSLCYRSGALIQKKMQSQIRQLVALNPKATFLRFQRTFYELKLISVVVTYPPGIPVVLKKIGTIKADQKKLSSKQKSILKKGRDVFYKEIEKVKRKFRREGYFIQYKNDFPMALKETPLKSDSPNYVSMEPFSQKQNLTIQWKMNVFQFLPSYIKNMFGFNQNKEFGCSVSLNSLRKLYSIKIMKDGGVL